ncbi:MAG: hemolysin family protein [Microbacteriaceae bacterium]
MADWAGLAWLVVLLAGNAFFVGAEFAVISAKRSSIEPLAQKGKRSAKTALWAMEHATLMLATCQLGITVCSLLILNVSEPALHHLLGYPFGWFGIPLEWADPFTFVLALLIVTYLHVVFGEMVPKNISFSMPDKAVLLLAPPLVWVSKIFRPLIFVLNGIANGVLRLFGVEPKNEAASAFTLDEVATIVSQSTREGVLHDTTGALSATFEFTEKKVIDVAIPKTKIIRLEEPVSAEMVEQAVADHGFSRYVISDTTNESIGYLHLKDVIDLTGEAFSRPVPARRIRQLILVDTQMDLEEALSRMRASGAHIAKVLDENGQSFGALFLEDIIEELVGEVRDATRRNREELD